VEIQLIWFGFIGVALTILLWLVPGNTQISIAFLIVSIILSLLLILTFFNAASKQFQKFNIIEDKYTTVQQQYESLELNYNKNLIPKIISTKKEGKGQNSRIVC
jgi:membrane protein implicated in regulation of membrane protease activity